MLLDEGEKWTQVNPEDLPLTALADRPNVPDADWLKRKAQELRITILQMVIRAGSGHIGGAYSAMDLVTALYFRVLKHDPSDPSWEGRDRLVYSKGHTCLALYTALAEAGYFRPSRLKEFLVDGGLLAGHPERGQTPGVEVTTGSLGHGLPLANGIAMGLKMDGGEQRVITVMGDGECNEGSNWEAFMCSAQFRLDNLTAVIDNNKLESLAPTSEIMAIEPMAEKLRAFGWGVREIDGHNMSEIVEALESTPFEPGKPSAVVAHTVKGRGVSFMEGVTKWHQRGLTTEEAETAFSELARGI
jgi:transketolase